MRVRTALRKLRKWERYHGRYQRLTDWNQPTVMTTAPSPGWAKAARRYVRLTTPISMGRGGAPPRSKIMSGADLINPAKWGH